ncbi:hypothetical protein E4U60_002557 [Claviceps pazoutovae]|uniref:Uncharacterized protein n=1 Tax=Claviceps pazoutovae TaxID=1649127 RepID=A0A9P7SGQ3_9HYPO|nr:hypothetical protein E4U60_002557 [Claviceps pazoutovae]
MTLTPSSLAEVSPRVRAVSSLASAEFLHCNVHRGSQGACVIISAFSGALTWLCDDGRDKARRRRFSAGGLRPGAPRTVFGARVLIHTSNVRDCCMWEPKSKSWLCALGLSFCHWIWTGARLQQLPQATAHHTKRQQLMYNNNTNTTTATRRL